MSDQNEILESLKEIMVWIDNWSPNFCDDEEWQEVEERVKRIIRENQ